MMPAPPKRIIQKAPGTPDHFTKAEAVAAIKKVVDERERAERQPVGRQRDGRGRPAAAGREAA